MSPLSIQRAAFDELFAALVARGYRRSGRPSATARSSTTSSVERRPARGLDGRAGGRHLPARAPRRRGAVRLRRRPAVLEALPVPADVRLWRARRADGGARGRRGARRAAALRLHRRALLRAARDRDPGPRCLGRRATPIRDYAARREGVFVVALNCGQAGGTCFCVSMETGPRATFGYDIALTEVLEDGGHCFLVEAGSEPARRCSPSVSHATAGATRSVAAADRASSAPRAEGRDDGHDRHQGPALPQPRAPALGRGRGPLPDLRQLHDGLPDLLLHDASRTSPTSRARRPSAVSEWDSCFTIDFSYVHGGSVRSSRKSRYRQWMTHKLATWIDQFGTSGCVGCGRCITWCPVAIDITEEVAAIRADDGRPAATSDARAIDELVAEVPALRRPGRRAPAS